MQYGAVRYVVVVSGAVVRGVATCAGISRARTSPSTTQTSSNPPMSSPLPLVASLLPDERWLFDVDVSEERKGRRIDWKTRCW